MEQFNFPIFEGAASTDDDDDDDDMFWFDLIAITFNFTKKNLFSFVC